MTNPQPRSASIADPGGPPATTGTWNSDPAEDRTVFGLVGSTVPSQHTTAPTPEASAVRIIVPAFPGSRTSTHTMTIDISFTILEPCRGEAHHGQHRLGGDRVGNPLDHSRGQVEHPDTGGEHPVDNRCHRGTGTPLRCHIDRLDGKAGGQSHRQQLRTFHHQGPLRGAQAPLPEELPDPTDPQMVVGECALAQEAASALEPAPASASLATCTRAANASGSVTARSASTLRSTSTSAWWRPAINRL